MMRDFCSGRDAREDRRLRQQLQESVVVERLERGACNDLTWLETDLAAEVCCNLAVVAGNDLHRDPEPREACERFLHVRLGRVAEAEEAVQREAALVFAAEALERHRPAGDCDDARAGGKQPVERRARFGGNVGAAGQNAFGSALGDQQPSVGCVDEGRGELALVVERQAVEHRPGGVAVLRGARAGVERLVELVAGLLATGQAKRLDLFVRLALPVERLGEGDLPFGQRAGLVGEQHLDVAEVFDADEALDDHASPCEAARAGGEADGHDRRQQLRRQADRDRECEQRRLQKGPAERCVDHEDRAREHRSDGGEQARELLQPLLERCLTLSLAQAERDRAEGSVLAGLDHETASGTASHHAFP